MDLKNLTLPLSISEIDFRIQSINRGGYATILAYKDARVDMNRLDDVVGAENWARDHKEVKGVVYGGIGIYIKDRWVWKWDAGTESFTEKQKGEASDSFKRAGFNWGIGRELYDYPIINVKLFADEFEIKKDNSGRERAFATWNLKLKEWIWFSQFNSDDKISYLAAKDQNGKKRYEWGTYIK